MIDNFITLLPIIIVCRHANASTNVLEISFHYRRIFHEAWSVADDPRESRGVISCQNYWAGGLRYVTAAGISIKKILALISITNSTKR